MTLIQWYELNAEMLPAFRSLVLPEVVHLVEQPPASLRMVGAVYAGQPIGLALANQQGEGAASLLSCVVVEEARRKGIGRTLLQHMEALLQRDGCNAMTAEFLEEGDTWGAVGSFLTACGFAAPSPGIYIWSDLLETLREFSWVWRFRLPDSFSLEPWSSLTQTEREVVQAGHGVWYPPILSPFADEENFDHDRSTVLRYGGEVVGWMILERFDAETVLFKTMFVHRRHQRAGRGAALVADACRRMYHDPEFQQGIFFVEAENESMVQFMHNRLHDPGFRKQMLWRTAKSWE
jgi:GNAT superfamily N-acetyltransferase